MTKLKTKRRGGARVARRPVPRAALSSLPAHVWSPVAREWLASASLLLLALVTYFPALAGTFLWDDDAHVTAPALRSLAGLWRIWTDPFATQQYYPLTHSVFWLEYRLWGADPVGYHVVNVVLHVTSALLLRRILVRLGVPGAWLAAAIFVVHPVHVESVAWITELKNTLSGVFYLAALLVYLRFDPPGSRSEPGTTRPARAWRAYALAFGLFVCALLSKTTTVSLPAAILLIVWWKMGRVEWRRHVLPLVPFFLVGAAFGLTTAWIELRVVGAEGAAFAFTAVERLLIAGRAVWFYAGKLLWPDPLIFIYPRWTIDRSVWWQYLFPLAAIAALGALAVARSRIGRGPLAAALFFGGTLVPALGFFNVYPFMYSFVADHFQYLASLGLIVLGVAVITTWLDRARPEWKQAGRVVAVVLVAVLAVLSWRQAHLYADVETLYRDVIARNPSGSMAYVNLGSAYARQGRNADAIDVLSALLAHPPDPPTVQSELAIAHAHYEIGRAHAAQGRLEEAIADYRAALAGYQALPGASGSAAKAYQMLGVAYVGVGRYAEAITALNAALAIEPGLADVHYNLGVAHAALGELPSAASAYRAAIAIQADYPEAYNNLGLVYGKMGRIPAAIAAYRTAIDLRPDFAAAYNNLGSAYAAEGKNDEAIAAWTSAVRSDANGAAGRAARANLDTTRARLRR